MKQGVQQKIWLYDSGVIDLIYGLLLLLFQAMKKIIVVDNKKLSEVTF